MLADRRSVIYGVWTGREGVGFGMWGELQGMACQRWGIKYILKSSLHPPTQQLSRLTTLCSIFSQILQWSLSVWILFVTINLLPRQAGLSRGVLHSGIAFLPRSRLLDQVSRYFLNRQFRHHFQMTNWPNAKNGYPPENGVLSTNHGDAKGSASGFPSIRVKRSC